MASSPSFTQTPQAPRPPLGQPHRGPSPIFSPSLRHLQPHRVVSGGLRVSHVGSRGGKWRKIPAQLRGPTTPERGGVGAQRGVLHNACAATPRHGRVKRGRSWIREFPGFPKPTSAPAPFTPQSKFPRERGRDIGVGEDRAAAPYWCWCRSHCKDLLKTTLLCFLTVYFLIFVSANTFIVPVV